MVVCRGHPSGRLPFQIKEFPMAFMQFTEFEQAAVKAGLTCCRVGLGTWKIIGRRGELLFNPSRNGRHVFYVDGLTHEGSLADAIKAAK